MYQWLDEELYLFNNRSNWWCKNSRSPTNEVESCVVLRKDMSMNQFVCLDDQLCSQTFGFICEKCRMKKDCF